MILPCWAALLKSAHFICLAFSSPRIISNFSLTPVVQHSHSSAWVSIVTSLVSCACPTANLLCNTGWRTHYLQSAPQASPCQGIPWTKVNGQAWDDNRKIHPTHQGNIRRIFTLYNPCIFLQHLHSLTTFSARRGRNLSRVDLIVGSPVDGIKPAKGKRWHQELTGCKARNAVRGKRSGRHFLIFFLTGWRHW